MAHITYSAPSAAWPQRAVARLGAALVGVGRALAVSRQADARLREMQRLQALSDAELAKLGVSRDRIAHHVFRDIYYI